MVVELFPFLLIEGAAVIGRKIGEILRQPYARSLEGLKEQLFPSLDDAGTVSGETFHLDAYLRFRLGRNHEIEPLLHRVGLATRDDLHDIAIMELAVQGRDLAVDTSSDRMVSDVGMDRIGEIDRRRRAGQLKHIPLGREDEDGRRQDFFSEERTFLFQERVHRDAYEILIVPPDLLIAIDLIEDMRRCPPLRFLIHGLRADLYLDRLAVSLEAQHGGMQALVAIRFRNGDEVLESFREGREVSVYQTEDSIAIRDVIHDDPESKHIIDITYAFDAVLFQLPVDGVGFFDAVGDGVLILFREDFPHLLQRLGQESILFKGVVGQLSRDMEITVEIQLAQRQRLHGLLEGIEAQTCGDRGIDREGFVGYPLRYLRVLMMLERSEVIDAIGELDEDASDILCHRDERALEALRCSLVSAVFDESDFVESFYDLTDFHTKQLFNLCEGPVAIGDDIMQQGRNNRRDVRFDDHELGSGRNRVDDIGFSRLPEMALVGFLRIFIGFLYDRTLFFPICFILSDYPTNQGICIDGFRHGHIVGERVFLSISKMIIMAICNLKKSLVQ